MNKIFEKIGVFVLLLMFFSISYMVFNFEEIKVSHKLEEREPFILLETIKTPEWFREFVKCEDVEMIREENYFYSKCFRSDKKYYSIDATYKFPLKTGYKFHYNHEKDVVEIFIPESFKPKNELANASLKQLIQGDFMKYLDIGEYNVKEIKKSFAIMNYPTEKTFIKFEGLNKK